jgi:hypothetical protein
MSKMLFHHTTSELGFSLKLVNQSASSKKNSGGIDSGQKYLCLVEMITPISNQIPKPK